jgi:hypothetical protein
VHIDGFDDSATSILSSGNPPCDYVCLKIQLLKGNIQPLKATVLKKQTIVPVRPDAAAADSGSTEGRGSLVSGNVPFAALSLLPAQYTHSVATLRRLVATMKNRRSLTTKQVEEQLSCLIPHQNNVGDLGKIPAFRSQAGKMMRAHMREVDANGVYERGLPHLRKHRYE